MSTYRRYHPKWVLFLPVKIKFEFQLLQIEILTYTANFWFVYKLSDMNPTYCSSEVKSKRPSYVYIEDHSLFVWLDSLRPSNTFQLCRDVYSCSWVEPIYKQGLMYLARGHNAVPSVRLNRACNPSRSRVKHSTTQFPSESIDSIHKCECGYNIRTNNNRLTSRGELREGFFYPPLTTIIYVSSFGNWIWN